MEDLKETFRNPGSLYRGKPFWAWNGKLDEAELRRQVRVMHRMGLGGFFMHSRVGLATPYLSDEWFRMVEACAEEAERLGMEAWLYDEDRWPSGAAGGLVTRDPRYRQRRLRMEVIGPDSVPPEGEPIAAFMARLKDNEAYEVERLGPDWREVQPPAGSVKLAFYVRLEQPSPWYNDATYLDTLSHEAVRRFIEVTHEAYRRRVGERFGRVIPGIFTDEPNRGRVLQGGLWETHQAYEVPWTDRLPEVFSERYGYDLLDHLPEVFLRVEGRQVSRVRWHYHDCVTFLFVDAFARQIGEWCERNGLMLTGHVLMEETLITQTDVVGSTMRFYEHMQAPGIDILTEHRPEYITAKQCSSVLRQTGRRWMLSELYGCTGWDFPFEGHKAVGDWQAALGVNLRCQHLYWFTMAGEAKRDYPASIAHHSPWWELYPKVEDYFARVGAVMSRGEAVRDLLVVHPVESVWARAAAGWHADRAVRRLDRAFERLTGWLLDGHVDFDYGDEEMMARLGAVEGDRLRVGKALYKVVLVPPADTLRSSTVDLLERFAGAGGRVVFAGRVPRLVDCERSRRVRDLARRARRVPMRAAAVLEAVEPARVVNICDAQGDEKEGVFYLLHRDGERLHLFICNTDRRRPTGPLTVRVRGARGQVQRWDAETGQRYSVAAGRSGDAVDFPLALHPSGSALFVITAQAEDLPPEPRWHEVRSVRLPRRAFEGELTEPNVLVLDRPLYRLGDGPWQGPLEILKVDQQLRKAVGLSLRGGGMVQPWARSRKEQGPGTPFALKYTFRVDAPPRGPLWLAVEQPDRLRIALNGRELAPESECGWWVDKALRLLPLDEGVLRVGENELVMSGTLTDDTDLEICYLLGEFAVEVEGARARITGPLGRVRPGDWRWRGLPFYGGSVVYRTRARAEFGEGERLFVEVPRFAGACVRVLVDGRSAGVIGWPPHEVDLTPYVQPGAQFELAVEVVGHRRNAFGPLHHRDARPRWVGPAEFVSTGDLWREEFNLVPVGLLSAPRLSVRRPLQGD